MLDFGLIEKVKKLIVRLIHTMNLQSIYIRVKNSFNLNKRIYIMVFVYIIALSAFTILKEEAFLTSGFDLGIFNQSFWTALFKHRLFYATGDISFNPGGSFFGVHFSPILFLLLPIYAIYPTVEILLVMQTVVLAIGAFPLYWMSREKIGENAGVLVSLLYLLYPILIFVNSNDFHLEAFTSTFFLFSVYYLEREEWSKFSLFLILAFSTLEFAPIIGISVAVYISILYFKGKFKDNKKARKIILFTGLISVLWFVLSLQAKVFFNNTSPVPSSFENLWLNPIGLVNVLTTQWQDKLLYLLGIFGPLAFLPLLGPEALVMLVPWVGASFLSTYSLYYSVYFQYGGFVIPFVFVALVKAVERAKFRDTRKVLSLLLISTVIFGLYFSHGPLSPWNFQIPTPNNRTQSINNILQLIPNNASVLTENDLFPHVSSRTEAYMYPPLQGNFSVDYIFVDVSSIWYTWQQPAIYGERIPVNVVIQDVLTNGSYGIYAEDNSVFLLKKGYVDKPIFFSPYVSVYDYRSLKINSASIVDDVSSSSKKVLFHNENDSNSTFWYGPYTNLPQGLYRATYRLKIDSASELNQTMTIDATSSSGTKLLANKQIYGINAPLNGKWFNISLLFGLSLPTQGVEFRGTVVGDANVSLDYICIEQLSPEPTNVGELSFNSENFFVKNGVISGDLIVSSNQSGTLWYGPYTSLPKGNYTAKFWIDLYRRQVGPLLELGVTSNAGQVLIADSIIYDSNFTRTQSWQSFELNFSLTKNYDSIEFPGIALSQSAQLSFLLVEVHPDIG
jgi:uncharacterized membrane protein